MLSVDNLSKSFGIKTLFQNISFSIPQGQRIGLIGVNGTGKSSLLRIIAGLEAADSGKIIHSSHYRIAYLDQDPQFSGTETVIQHIYGSSHGEIENVEEYEAKTILSRLGINDYHISVNQLSGGQKKRVALAAALVHPADLLILDEPTNHIDNETAEWLEGELSRYRGALILVTHDRYFLDRVVNRILELHQGQIYPYEGNYAYFLEKKAERQEQQAASEDKRRNLLRRELEWLRRGAKARTTKQKARIQRAEELQEGKPDGRTEALEMSVSASRLGKKVMELVDISKSYGEHTLLQDFSYLVLPKDRIGIIGSNGKGKTTLLQMLAGKLQPDTGTIETGVTVRLAYYTQESEELDPNRRVLEYIRDQAETVKLEDGKTVTASQMLERFMFSQEQQWTYIGKLSGGEKRRLYLLKTLMGEPNVLLLDEPTNDLDIQTLTILGDYLEHFPGAVIAVSHDRFFLDRIADKLFAFEDDAVIRTFMGSYSDYLEERKQENAVYHQPDKGANGSDREQPASSQTARPRKLSYKEQKEWDGIEERISRLEEELEAIKQQLVEAGSDSVRVQELFLEQTDKETELDKTMTRWTELSELVESIQQQQS